MSNGVDLHGIAHDTMLQSYIINSTDNRHDLNTVASVFGSGTNHLRKSDRKPK